MIDSERLTSSMLLMLEESTVTWISTGLPSNRIEAVYTPGQNLGASALSRGVSILEEAEAFTVFALRFSGIPGIIRTIAAKTDNSEYNKSYYNSDDNSSNKELLNGITTILV